MARPVLWHSGLVLSVLAFIGSGCGPKAKSQASAPVEENVLASLDDLLPTLYPSTGRRTWDVSISADGQAYAFVQRGEDPSTGLRRDRVLNVSGTPGDRYDVIGPVSFSKTGHSWLYLAFTSADRKHHVALKEPTYFVVFNGQQSAPFGQRRPATAMSDDGVRWAAFTFQSTPSSQPGAADVFQYYFVTGEGRRVDLPLRARAATVPLRFDTSTGTFRAAYTLLLLGPQGQVTDDVCEIDEHGSITRPPPRPPAASPATLPASVGGAAVEVKLVGPRLSRHEAISVNGQPVGEYDAVLTSTAGARPAQAFPQPDGRLKFFAVRGNQLIEVLVRP